MTTGRAIHRAEDGTETDITEGVQALYDLVLNSMDWGSGFLTWEDALPMALVGKLLGFEKADEAERYLLARKQETEHYAAYCHDETPAIEHDHILSSMGKCMWPRCSYVKGPEA